VAHLYERLENVERQLFRANDVSKVVERRAALLDVIDADVVLTEHLVCFLIRNIAPLVW
jgi:hypothetical protein